ncbi:MAG TPA: KH domain-containing protein [Acidimicrobiales bacterium]|nr:KH domain-containing protein [Acidimicrobiales bacterium]
MTTAEEYEPADANTIGTVEYEEGDVNAVVGEEPEDDEAGNRARGGTPVAVLEYVARSLAEEPDAVVVHTEERRGTLRLQLHVAPGDMGRVIGRRGRTAQAIRTLVGVAGARDGVDTSVDIVDE